MNEQSVKSSPDKFRWDNPRTHGMGSNGSLATTRPSKLKSQKYIRFISKIEKLTLN
jgi:hypothetical protein